MMPLVIIGQPVAAPAFEVASVKLHPLLPGSFGFGPGNAIRIAGNRITLDRNTLTGLVMTAYNVKDFQIFGMPEWTRNREQLYDIAAKTEGEAATTMELVRPMLQTLLADRFQLKLHSETKELPVYNLVIDKKGPKLKESVGARPPKPVTFSGLSIGLNLLDKSMADLIAIIAGYVDRPVLDKTGLAGRYDFTLEFTHSNPDLVPRDSPDADRSIFTALQEQLGLKLAPAKEPTDFLVIDRAERPSEN
jgi:uncharacterized protein (TIGR03435 family)